MPLLREIIDCLEAAAPLELCESYDNSGLVAGDPGAAVDCALLSLDVTAQTVAEAREAGAQAVISHHPPYLAPIKSVVRGTPAVGAVYEAIRCGVGLACMHTNMDAAAGGVSDALCRALGLESAGVLVRRGEQGHGFGRMCSLDGDEHPADFAARASRALGCAGVWLTDCGRMTRRLCVIGGSGGDFLRDAACAGADTVVTGEVKHHEMLLAREMGLNIIAVGHHASEWPVVAVFKDILARAFPELHTVVSGGAGPSRLII